MLTGLLSLPGSASFLMQSRHTCLGMDGISHTDLGHPISSGRQENVPADVLTGPSDGDQSSVEAPPFQHVTLTTEISHRSAEEGVTRQAKVPTRKRTVNKSKIFKA